MRLAAAIAFAFVSLAAVAAPPGTDPFGMPKTREREERAAIDAQAAGDAHAAYDLAMRRSLYFRALGAYATGARLAAYAAAQADGANRANALLEAASLYRVAGDVAAARKATDAAAVLVDANTPLAKARLALVRAIDIADVDAQLRAIDAVAPGDDAPDDVRFVVATARANVLSDARRFADARKATDRCGSLRERVDPAMPEHLTCLLSRVYVQHALDVNGNVTADDAQAYVDWLAARVGPDTPAGVMMLVNWCNLSFPDSADYQSSERACETAQHLLEHPDWSTRRGQYAFSLALGRGLAIQNQHGRAREALPHLTQALSLATLSKKADDIAMTLSNLGWAHYQAGDAPSAKPLLERVLREWPTSVYTLTATLSLGDIACGEGAYDEARRRFEAGRALAAKLAGEDSPRRRYFVERLAMLEKIDGERCSRP